MVEGFKDLCTLKAFGLDEVVINQCLSCNGVSGITISCESNAFDNKISVANECASEVDYQQVLNKLINILGDKLYCDQDKSLEEVAVEYALNKGIKIAVAESITGGLLCAKIVNVPGSSNVLKEGFVTYSNEAKVRRLHVKLPTIEQYGAVSSQVAQQMLVGLLENNDNTFAISTTGCAGPESDEADTPIGLVYIGFGDRTKSQTKEFFYHGSRNYIRECVANQALYEMLQYCQKKYK